MYLNKDDENFEWLLLLLNMAQSFQHVSNTFLVCWQEHLPMDDVKRLHRIHFCHCYDTTIQNVAVIHSNDLSCMSDMRKCGPIVQETTHEWSYKQSTHVEETWARKQRPVHRRRSTTFDASCVNNLIALYLVFTSLRGYLGIDGLRLVTPIKRIEFCDRVN